MASYRITYPSGSRSGQTTLVTNRPMSVNSAKSYVNSLPGAMSSVTKPRIVSSGSGSVPGMSTLDDVYTRLKSISDANNAWSAAQAQKQMDFQKESADTAMKFNHDEAELSRLWQERMSNTAHQREIKDLQAAGLNPVLSAMGGSGAPVTSGATASGYTSQRFKRRDGYFFRPCSCFDDEFCDAGAGINV